MKLSVAIQHHPSREARLASLLDTVPHAYVARDPEPETKNNWPCARLAWLAREPDATHHLVLEDDAVPCEHFIEGVEEAVSQRPDRALALWANRAQIGEALDLGEHWTRCRGKFYGTVAVVLPGGWTEAFVRWGDGEKYRGLPSVDWRMREFLTSIRQRVLFSAPCLVQHGEPADSLLWKKGGILNGRVTQFFADDLGIDVRSVDWSKGDR